MTQTLRINEKFWGRADYKPDSDNRRFEGSLANSKGKMCCLGFVGQACGLTKKEMRGELMPHDVENPAEIEAKFPWLFDDGPDSRCSEVAFELSNINDSNYATLAEKRKQIREIFKQNGVKVVFVKE